MTEFSELNLSVPLNKALDHLGYTTPTPIQQQAIPNVLAGRDLMGIAQTGTGKTAAFALPSLDHIVRHDRQPPKRGARVLVLAPTRELAEQITVSFTDYGRSIDGLRVFSIFGGVPISRQIKRLVKGNDVLVATPGRLIDLLDRKDLRLDEVELLILDEADQMMDMGFIHALKKIVPHLPEDRQTLFFSATMTPKIQKLASQFLTDPVSVSVSPPNTTADKVDQSLIYVSAKEKQDLLGLTLSDPMIARALVFTRTKHGADRVVKRLAKIGIEAVAIHGNKSQSQRRRALAAFRDGNIRFLIATDIAARGIDIEGISHVINFEIPNVPEQYVHRIGRTARANMAGTALSFVADDERAYLKDIQKLLKTTIPVQPLPEDFNKKAQALAKRAPLPKPPKPEGQGNSHKRPKRRKKPKTAEELLQETDGQNKQKSSKPKRHQGSKTWHKGDRSQKGAHKGPKNKNRDQNKSSGNEAQTGEETRQPRTNKSKSPGGSKRPIKGFKGKHPGQGRPGGRPKHKRRGKPNRGGPGNKNTNSNN